MRRQVDREGHDLGPRDHRVVHLLVGEVEDLVEHLLLRLLDVLGLRHDQADVLLRVRVIPAGAGWTPKRRAIPFADCCRTQTGG